MSIPHLGQLSLTVTIILFVAATAAVFVVGPRMVSVADQLSERTGVGKAIFGAIFLGASTSLPGVVLSITAAAGDHPKLAVSNALGGIAAQTVFIAIADIAYRKEAIEQGEESLATRHLREHQQALEAVPAQEE